MPTSPPGRYYVLGYVRAAVDMCWRLLHLAIPHRLYGIPDVYHFVGDRLLPPNGFFAIDRSMVAFLRAAIFFFKCVGGVYMVYSCRRLSNIRVLGR